MKFSYCNSMLASFLAVGLITGCGSPSGPKPPEGPKGSAKAKVSYEGKPITKGILILDSGKGYTASAPVKPDGTFDLKGPNGADVPAGTYKVAISPPPSPPPAAGASEMSPPPTIEGLPEKFYGTDTSGVTVEIKPGKQDLDIVLQ